MVIFYNVKNDEKTSDFSPYGYQKTQKKGWIGAESEKIYKKLPHLYCKLPIKYV